MADSEERPTVEGFAAPLKHRGHLMDALHHRPGQVNGVRGLPPDDHRFIYQVGFESLGPPTNAEAIVFLWLDEPTMDDLTLRQLAVIHMLAMVERGV